MELFSDLPSSKGIANISKPHPSIKIKGIGNKRRLICMRGDALLEKRYKQNYHLEY